MRRWGKHICPLHWNIWYSVPNKIALIAVPKKRFRYRVIIRAKKMVSSPKSPCTTLLTNCWYWLEKKDKKVIQNSYFPFEECMFSQMMVGHYLFLCSETRIRLNESVLCFLFAFLSGMLILLLSQLPRRVPSAAGSAICKLVQENTEIARGQENKMSEWWEEIRFGSCNAKTILKESRQQRVNAVCCSGPQHTGGHTVIGSTTSLSGL